MPFNARGNFLSCWQFAKCVVRRSGNGFFRIPWGTLGASQWLRFFTIGEKLGTGVAYCGQACCERLSTVPVSPSRVTYSHAHAGNVLGAAQRHESASSRLLLIGADETIRTMVIRTFQVITALDVSSPALDEPQTPCPTMNMPANAAPNLCARAQPPLTSFIRGKGARGQSLMVSQRPACLRMSNGRASAYRHA